MTAYENFINEFELEKGKFARLWELEIKGHIENLIDFSREFLETQGLSYTGYNKNFKAIFNNKYVFDGIIKDGDKIALRIIKL